VMLGLKYLPSVKSLNLIGKASYHIFLVQVAYFAIAISRWDNRGGYEPVLSTVVNLAICVGLGLVFYYLDNLSRRAVNRNVNKLVLNSSARRG